MKNVVILLLKRHFNYDVKTTPLYNCQNNVKLKTKKKGRYVVAKAMFYDDVRAYAYVVDRMTNIT